MSGAVKRHHAMIQNARGLWDKWQVVLAADHDRIVSSLAEAGVRMQAERDTLRAEVERLTGCLQKANEQAEHFEREWYLRVDEVERLRILLKEWLDADEHKDWGEYERRVEKALEASR